MHAVARLDNMRDVLLHEHPSECIADRVRLVVYLESSGREIHYTVGAFELDNARERD